MNIDMFYMIQKGPITQTTYECHNWYITTNYPVERNKYKQECKEHYQGTPIIRLTKYSIKNKTSIQIFNTSYVGHDLVRVKKDPEDHKNNKKNDSSIMLWRHYMTRN